MSKLEMFEFFGVTFWKLLGRILDKILGMIFWQRY